MKTRVNIKKRLELNYQMKVIRKLLHKNYHKLCSLDIDLITRHRTTKTAVEWCGTAGGGEHYIIIHYNIMSGMISMDYSETELECGLSMCPVGVYDSLVVHGPIELADIIKLMKWKVPKDQIWDV